jgi:hypothetical protein
MHLEKSIIVTIIKCLKKGSNNIDVALWLWHSKRLFRSKYFLFWNAC